VVYFSAKYWAYSKFTSDIRVFVCLRLFIVYKYFARTLLFKINGVFH